MVTFLLLVTIPCLVRSEEAMCPGLTKECPTGKKCCSVGNEYTCCNEPAHHKKKVAIPGVLSKHSHPFENASVIEEMGPDDDECNFITCPGTCCGAGPDKCCPLPDGICCTIGNCCHFLHNCCDEGRSCCPFRTKCCGGGKWCCKEEHTCGSTSNTCIADGAESVSPIGSLVLVLLVALTSCFM